MIAGQWPDSKTASSTWIDEAVSSHLSIVPYTRRTAATLTPPL